MTLDLLIGFALGFLAALSLAVLVIVWLVGLAVR